MTTYRPPPPPPPLPLPNPSPQPQTYLPKGHGKAVEFNVPTSPSSSSSDSADNERLPPPYHDAGSFQGGTFSIGHRDTNAVLLVDLQPGAVIKSKRRTMIHMSGTVHLHNKIKFTPVKWLTKSQITESTFTGPGRVALAPTLFGDIITLPIDGHHEPWNIGKEAYLASTMHVKKDPIAQKFSRAFLSNQELFVYRLRGRGIVWLTSFGAVDRLELAPFEQHVVDSGHLVAWNCKFSMGTAGGMLNAVKAREGLVCKFTGPGTLFIQTRNRDQFDRYIRQVSPPTQTTSGYSETTSLRRILSAQRGLLSGRSASIMF